MKVDTFKNRFRLAMNFNNLKQVDLVNKTKLDKSLINKYANGVTEPSNNNMELLAKALNVNEVWLMGHDVDVNGNSLNANKKLSEKELLFYKTKDILSDSEWATIEFIMNKALAEYNKRSS